MKDRFVKRARIAGAGNMEYGDRVAANSGKIFHSGINQKLAYEKIENELTVYQIKKRLYEIGCKLYDELNEIEDMLESSKNLSFRELEYIFDILESKKKLVARFEEFEMYIKKNIYDIKNERDIRRIKRMFRIG